MTTVLGNNALNTFINKVQNNQNKEQIKVLIVEDDKDNRDLLHYSVSKKGYITYAFSNALDALEFLKKETIDIIISDIMLPKMDGNQFCSVVKKSYKHIYFIAVTAKTNNQHKVKTLRQGADDYISKPYDIMELLARVKAGARIIQKQKELVHLNEKLEKVASTDQLTGLKNRRFFFEVAPKELKRSERYGHTSAVILMDVDNFKNINDSYGHNAGDEALKTISAVLQDSLRESDILCRYGGDEFILFIPETNPRNAFKVGEKIRKRINNTTLNLNNHTIPLSITIGVAIKTPERKLSLQDLIKKADSALYEAKNQGRNKTIINKWYNIKSIL